MRQLLRRSSTVKVVGTANHLTETIEQVRRLHPNVVLLDIPPMTPEGVDHCAFDAIVFMKRNDRQLRVLVMSLFGRLGPIDRLKKVGVSGFIYPEFGFEQVVRMIHVSCRPKRKRKDRALTALPMNRRKVSSKEQFHNVMARRSTS